MTTRILSMVALLALPLLAQAERLVVMDGALTEIVYALGAERDLVAVDLTSRYPVAATKLPSVGYLRALSAEGVLSLAPDHIITTREAGPPAVIAQLRAARIRIDIIDNDYSIDGTVTRIRTLARLTGRQREGEQLADTVAQQSRAVIEALPADNHKLLVLLAAGSHGVMAAGGATHGDALITLLKARNAVTTFSGYKPISAEAIMALDPDAIVIASNGSTPLPDTLQQALAQSRAARHQRIVSADSMLLLGFGARLPQALRLVAHTLQPQIALAP